MTKLYALAAITFLLAACGGDASSAAAANETGKSSPDRNGDPKWVIAIEGLPERSGRNIVAVTMGDNGQYSMAKSGFVASVRVEQGNPAPFMMFTYDDENARCLNDGKASVTIDGDRAVLGGELLCMAKSGSDGEESTAGIEGWFELEK